MIFFDTNVLLYAIGSPHEPARRLIAVQRQRESEGAVTLGVMEEFVHVSGRKRVREIAVAQARDFACFLDVVPTTIDDVNFGFTLYARYDRVGVVDAVLAGVAITYEAELVSADRAFGTIAGLRWMDLASPEIGRLL